MNMQASSREVILRLGSISEPEGGISGSIDNLRLNSSAVRIELTTRPELSSNHFVDKVLLGGKAALGLKED